MKWSDRTAQGFNPGWGEEKRALKVAPDVWAWLADQLYQFQTTSLRALVRRFVLVLVLDSLRAECWSTGVSEYCAFSELRPASAGLEVLSGRTYWRLDPGLKPG
jgi:hypothetical protein